MKWWLENFTPTVLLGIVAWCAVLLVFVVLKLIFG